MSQPKQFMLKDPTEGRTIGIVGDIYRFLATGEETGGIEKGLPKPANHKPTQKRNKESDDGEISIPIIHNTHASGVRVVL